jgi:hypothetical protein
MSGNKSFALVLVLFLLAGLARAETLTQAALQGQWAIVSMDGVPDNEGDLWIFEGNSFRQKIGRTPGPKETFEIKANVIDLGWSRITVLAFDGRTMTARWESGSDAFKYELKKR